MRVILEHSSAGRGRPHSLPASGNAPDRRGRRSLKVGDRSRYHVNTREK